VTNAEKIAAELEEIATSPDFIWQSGKLVQSWDAAKYGIEIVEPILAFMEKHPEIDFGAPGALVHFVEDFHLRGYEALLIASIERRPTQHTVLMLNRVVNGTNDTETKQRYLAALEQAKVKLIDIDRIVQPRD
jgi:hypothetical protein